LGEGDKQDLQDSNGKYLTTNGHASVPVFIS
jgi:hypothetical protein